MEIRRRTKSCIYRQDMTGFDRGMWYDVCVVREEKSAWLIEFNGNEFIKLINLRKNVRGYNICIVVKLKVY